MRQKPVFFIKLVTMDIAVAYRSYQSMALTIIYGIRQESVPFI